MMKVAQHILALVLALSSRSAFALETDGVVGFWEGTITYSGASLPVRLQVMRDGEERGYHAFLDIPSLVYAHQELPISCVSPRSCTLSFPFGIGDIPFDAGENYEWGGRAKGFYLSAKPARPVSITTRELRFGAFEPELEGTLYLPEGAGPFPLVMIIGGSGQATRAGWGYSSWTDFYIRLGYAAFIYDRRPDYQYKTEKSLYDIHDQALDLASAIEQVRGFQEINPEKIFLAGGSRGAWIALATARQIPDLAGLILISPASVTPAEQEVDANLTGMGLDGVSSADIAAAKNFYRLYFFIAKTGEGWDLLEKTVSNAGGTVWGQYVPLPESREDLEWWNANMDFDAAEALKTLTIPVLAVWGESDYISPWFRYRTLLERNLALAGNDDVTTMVFAEADHRIEISPGQDKEGNWRWFGMAPGFLETLRSWLEFRADRE